MAAEHRFRLLQSQKKTAAASVKRPIVGGEAKDTNEDGEEEKLPAKRPKTKAKAKAKSAA